MSPHAQALQSLPAADRAVIGAIARGLVVTPRLLDDVLEDGWTQRWPQHGLQVSVATRSVDVADPDGVLRDLPSDSSTAQAMTRVLCADGRADVAASLLLEAGDAPAAVRVLRDQPVHQAVSDPAVALRVLARVGAIVSGDPVLLLARATATSLTGHHEEAWEDINKARELLIDVDDPALKRWFEVVDTRFDVALHGHRESAVARITTVLAEVDPDETPTLAMGYHVLGEVAALSERREDLQRAAMYFRTAIAMWEAARSWTNARRTRGMLVTDVLNILGPPAEAWAEMELVLRDPGLSNNELSWFRLVQGFILIDTASWDDAATQFVEAERLARLQSNPLRVAVVRWGQAVLAARRGDLTGALAAARAAANTALSSTFGMSVLFYCDMSAEFGAIGELTIAAEYLAQAQAHPEPHPELVAVHEFLLAARRGVLDGLDEAAATVQPSKLCRVLVVAARAAAARGDLEEARDLLTRADVELASLGQDDYAAVGESRTHHEVCEKLGVTPGSSEESFLPGSAHQRHSRPPRRQLILSGATLALVSAEGTPLEVQGRPQRALLALVGAAGGALSVDRAAEALWPGEAGGLGRRRLRNVQTRLRDSAGAVVVRHGDVLRLGDDVACDLIEFTALAERAAATLRADPDAAGVDAAAAVRTLQSSNVLQEFYDDWADDARNVVRARMSILVEFLTVQAADAADAPGAAYWAQRSLELGADRDEPTAVARGA